MLKIGDRILGRRPPEDYWYPGTIRHSVGQRFYVIFDDGEDALLPPEQLRPLRLEIGDLVFARRTAEGDFEPAHINDKAEDRLYLAYEDGEQGWVGLDVVRIRPEARRQGRPAPRPPRWEVCDRVWACWFDLDWYPGIVLAAEEDRVHVLLDNGSQAPLLPERVRPFQLAVGEAVFCRRWGAPEFVPAEIVRIEGEKVYLRFEEGDEEWTSARLLRLHRDDWLPGDDPKGLNVGDHVLARWFDLWWYPGLVLWIEGKRIHIAFFDGDQALVTPDQVRELAVAVGDRVFCRQGGGPQYLPAEVTERTGDRIHVHYDDGTQEWSSIRMVRLEH
jgi:hypothetical protein